MRELQTKPRITRSLYLRTKNRLMRERLKTTKLQKEISDLTKQLNKYIKRYGQI